ncbi:NAD(P)/FAD-dependent oxidoreductase [Thermodesulfobacteriota bacterium]
MGKEHFLVIGNGPAGNQAALTLREEAPEARVTLISKEQEGCYRPNLLPDFIAGKIEEKKVFATSLTSYRERDIKLRSGQEVVNIDFGRRKAVLDHMEIIPYSGIIISVGGFPRIPEPLTVFKDLMFTLKTLQDANTWIDHLAGVDAVLMIGGDLTSLAVTKALLHLGKKVFFLLDEDAFWPLRTSQDLIDEISDRLTRKGVEVLQYGRLKSMVRLSDNHVEVEVDKQKIRVGMIGAFFGLVPNIQFLARSGLRVDRGILVDEYLNCGYEGVYATGDCAQIYHPEIHDYWVSIGHDNAKFLGNVAALNLLGGTVEVEVAKESIFEVQGIKINTSWWTEF